MLHARVRVEHPGGPGFNFQTKRGESDANGRSHRWEV